jgi:O-antigen ligase
LVDSRPLTGAGAQVIAFVLIVLMGSREITPRRKLLFGLVSLGTLIVSQQRTVWVVVIVVFLIWAAASLRRNGGIRHRRLAAIGVAALVAAAAALTAGLATGSIFQTAVTETTSRHSTFQYRVTGWYELLHADHSPAAIIIGNPFGSGYRRTIFGVATNVAPHSLYVAAILRLGLIGLAALAFLYWNVWRHRLQAAIALGVYPLTIVLLLVALLVFSVTYEPGQFASALIAGLLASELRPRSQLSAEPASSHASLLMGVGA